MPVVTQYELSTTANARAITSSELSRWSSDRPATSTSE